jgi:alpha-mannosidase
MIKPVYNKIRLVYTAEFRAAGSPSLYRKKTGEVLMSALAARLHNIKMKTGGSREIQGWEQGTGVPENVKHRYAAPGAENRRILTELEFALRMSAASGGGWDDETGRAMAILEKSLETQGVLTGDACMEAEKAILPLGKAAKEYTVLFASHAHIDMNWMWSWQETVQSSLATFRTILSLMDEYPEFTFSQSQASCYHLVEKYDPELMEEIKKRIKEGRWEVTASAWVETDKNMPNTESLIRHIRYTKNYLQSVWGVDPASLTIDFSPDTFGHSANIPEIDAYGGVKYMYHCRGLAEKYVLYRWRSPSGAELLCQREPYWYNRGINDEIAVDAGELAKTCSGLKTSLIVYGVGDHGGGPTRRDIEKILELREWPVYPSLRFGTFAEYFKAAETVRDKLPIVDGEINFVFTGCYTTQSRIKLGNRLAEAALLDAEALDAVSKVLTGKQYPAEKLEHAWRRVLFSHFHDIITGSCVRDSRDYAMAKYSEVQAAAGTAREKAALALAGEIDTSMIRTGRDAGTRSEGAGAGFGLDFFGGVPSPERGRGAVRIYHVFNSCAHKRREIVEFTLWDWDYNLNLAEVTDPAGNTLPFQLLDREPVVYWDHRYVRFIVQVEVPAGGYTTVVFREKEYHGVSLLNFRDPRRESPHDPLVLENDCIRAEFDPASGALRSLRDKKTGGEKIAAGKSAGMVLAWAEKKTNNAWLIGRIAGEEPLTRPVCITPLGGDTPLRQGFVIEQEILRSRIKTEVFLDKDAKALAFRFNVVWNEAAEDYKHVPVLRYALPLNFEPEAYQSDVPAGTQRRQSSFQDIPGLQYTAAVGGGEALALVTDSKYGYRGCEDVLSVTLINTASSPDPYPERGEHAAKLWIALEKTEPKALTEAAGDLCRGMYVISGGSHKGGLPPEGELLRLDAASTALSSVGLTPDGALLVRVYETAGNRDTVSVTAPDVIKAAELVDLDGRILDSLKPEGRTVSFSILPWKIGAVKIRFA